MHFQDKIKALITLLNQWLQEPRDYVQLEQWYNSAQTIAWTFEFSEQEEQYVDRIIEMYYTLAKMELSKNDLEMNDVVNDANTDKCPKKEYLDELLARKQTEQRTEEWYQQMSTIISASELGNLFASPYQRAKFVKSKTVPYKIRNQPLAIPSERMSAFDWGIRFEPVVKQIYEYKYGAIIKELGRLPHPMEPRCMASPDGLIYDTMTQSYKNKVGRLIEIKCPVTREIDGGVPKEYYDQMQMQLHVTGLQKCDYVEAVFSSKYNNIAMREGPTLYDGYIALVRYAEVQDNKDFYYIYSPVNSAADWMPIIQMEEEIIEIIPWRLVQWSEQIVIKNEEWWNTLQPIIERFWEDVEKEKEGKFIAPESKRAVKKPKLEVCRIIFTKMDESNNESNNESHNTMHIDL